MPSAASRPAAPHHRPDPVGPFPPSVVTARASGRCSIAVSIGTRTDAAQLTSRRRRSAIPSLRRGFGEARRVIRWTNGQAESNASTNSSVAAGSTRSPRKGNRLHRTGSAGFDENLDRRSCPTTAVERVGTLECMCIIGLSNDRKTRHSRARPAPSACSIFAVAPRMLCGVRPEFHDLTPAAQGAQSADGLADHWIPAIRTGTPGHPEPDPPRSVRAAASRHEEGKGAARVRRPADDAPMRSCDIPGNELGWACSRQSKWPWRSTSGNSLRDGRHGSGRIVEKTTDRLERRGYNTQRPPKRHDPSSIAR